MNLRGTPLSKIRGSTPPRVSSLAEIQYVISCSQKEYLFKAQFTETSCLRAVHKLFQFLDSVQWLRWNLLRSDQLGSAENRKIWIPDEAENEILIR